MVENVAMLRSPNDSNSHIANEVGLIAAGVGCSGRCGCVMSRCDLYWGGDACRDNAAASDPENYGW